MASVNHPLESLLAEHASCKTEQNKAKQTNLFETKLDAEIERAFIFLDGDATERESSCKTTKLGRKMKRNGNH